MNQSAHSPRLMQIKYKKASGIVNVQRMNVCRAEQFCLRFSVKEILQIGIPSATNPATSWKAFKNIFRGQMIANWARTKSD